MKRIITLCLIGLGTLLSAQAQTVLSCADAKKQPKDAIVTVSGVVMNGDELGSLIRYLDDGTAGLAIYFGTGTGAVTMNPRIERGDSVIATGKVAPFNNLFELTPITSYRIVSKGNRIHAPIQFSGDTTELKKAYNETYEGRLVRINRVINVQSSGGGSVSTFVGNINYKVSKSNTLVFRTNAASTGVQGVVGKPAPSDTFSLIGVMSQFSSSIPNAGYQLLPRYFDDFVGAPYPLPNITTPASLLETSKTTLSIYFQTQFEGTTEATYGTSPSALTSTFEDTTKTTSHSFMLSGLQPGTIYYVKVKSSNAYGTSNSSVVSFVTQSNSTGAIKTYFTRSVRLADAMPDNPATTLTNLVDDTLIAHINRAKESLDIAIYNWNNNGLSDITAAVNAAYARGVKVRVIADGSTANLGTNSLNPAIRVLESPTTAAPGGGFYTIMHNKFVIIDAESSDPNRPLVWTGSTNWTAAMMTTDYNNVVTVQDQSLARVYKVEFEEMWGSDSLKPGAIYNGTTGTARFGPTKSDNTPHYIKLASGFLNCYFSPSDGVGNKITEFISSASTSLQVAVFSWTKTDAAYAIRDKVNIWGPTACSRMLTEDTSGTGTGLVFRIAASAMQGGAQIFKPSGIFHHKYIIADQAAPSIDPKVLTGSHNWSSAADTRNDENTLIIHDRAIANQFYQEFSARWEQNGQTSCLAVATAPSLSSKIEMAPVPATNILSVSVPHLRGRMITVLNIDGKKVLTQKASADQVDLVVETLAPGAYLLRIEGMAVPARFVKQ